MKKPIRLLIVEDSKVDAALVVREFERAAYDVDSLCVDTRVGMRKAFEQKWDVVISDYVMPSFSALAALEETKTRGEPGIPFIIVSGAIGEEAAIEAMQKGADDFILKKNLSRLVPAVERELTEAAERRRSQEELRQSEERYRLLVDNIKDYAIIFLDTDGRVTSWNQGAQKILGYTSQEILNSYFSKFFLPEDVVVGKPASELRAAAETGRFEDYSWRIRKDGSRFWANVIIAAIRDESNTLRGFSKVTRDLTERRLAEGRLQEMNENLEKNVEKRTAELEKVTARLEEAVRSRDIFLSIASHELKTPLTSLKLQAQIRERIIDRQQAALFTPEKLKKMVQDDTRQINRLTRLVDDMLDITRLSSGKLTLQPQEDVDLCALVQDVIERFNPQLQSAGCDLSIDCPEKILGFWDPVRIDQVFVNFFTNVMKYGAGKPLHVNLNADESTARFTIQDQGIGIAPEDQQRVFEQFERVTSAGNISGLGIGLYIVQQIVKAHGGNVHLKSALGQGTRFTVELPRTQKAVG